MSTVQVEDADLLPKRVFVRRDEGVTVARAGLGLTLYLEDGSYWANGGARHWLGRYLDFIDRAKITYYTTSKLERWMSIDSEEQARLVEELSVGRVGGGIRHLLEVRFADDPGAGRYGFVYREVDSARSPRTGVLQLFFPNDHPPQDLLALAIELAQEAPIACGVGGWVARWNPMTMEAAFREMLHWTRRYWSLDLQWPDRFAFHARAGLPSIGWLTLVGPSLAARVEELGSPPASMAHIRLGKGALLRAGEVPELGDSHRAEQPLALFEAAHFLEPLLVADPPSFPAPHWNAALTKRWQRRFFSIEDWI